MPKIGGDDANMVQANAGHFGFSHVQMEDLGASEYTEVVIINDCSGSVASFRKQMEACLKEIVKSCAFSPRADNLLLRVIRFDTNVSEIHGFKLLSQCNIDDYDGCLQEGGMTALYDASVDGIESAANFGRDLQKQDFTVNAIVIVLTDGCDNASTLTIAKVAEALGKCVTGECVESLVSILIGVNVQDSTVSTYLQKFASEPAQGGAGFTQYVELKDATAKTLAKLAKFVSQSISSQSQQVGSGQPSAPISATF